MRLLLFGMLWAGLSLPLAAQSSETGEGPDGTVPRAQPVGDMGDPGASQDAEAAREKLLKAADQIDLMETNSEAIKASVDGMKSDLARLSDANTALQAQVATLQDTVTKQQDELDKMEADRTKERQALIDEVAALVAEKTASHRPHPAADEEDAAPAPKHARDDEDAATPPAVPHGADPLAPPPETSGPVAEGNGAAAPADATTDNASPATETKPAPPATATVHPRKGYYHVVAAHETLSLICEAYRDHGVEVTVAQIRRANGLTSKSELRVGQKLFIPKPST